jgi:hypothetical protein
MKKSILFTFLSLLIFSFSAQAQEDNRYSSTRLNNLANQLKRQTVDLADRTSEDLRRNNSSTRTDVEAAFLAQQLDASAGLFQQMVSDGNRAAALRDAASILSDLSRRAPNYGSNSYLWRDAANTINDINRELGGNNNGNGNNDNNNNNNGNVIGRAFWRGTVDSRVQISLQGKNITASTFAGRDYGTGVFSFTSPLPRRNVSVEVIKKAGRGDVRVVQQPSRNNDYTAIIEIVDNDGGAKEYQLEIIWR